MNQPNGVLPVDKPVGPTSHDVVAIARRALGTRRIGHTGTLDPFASGLLLLCIGPATRLAEYLTGLPKSYHATMRLGVVTDTDDREGAVLQTDEGWARVSRDEVAAALAGRVGTQLQTPPQYSAKKVAGERAYVAAREGREVSIQASAVTITRIELTRFALPEVDFDVDCSSGTYIRSLARDLGESLGVGAHLSALRRTGIGDRSVEGALSMDELGDPDAVRKAFLTPAEAVSHLARVPISESEARIVSHGGAIARSDAPEGAPLALRAEDGSLVAIGSAIDGLVKPTKVFI